MENNQLFRQKTLDRISSPEQLHDYLRVTSPKLWMILAAVIALMVGLIVFSSATTMENSIPVKVDVRNFVVGEENGQPIYDVEASISLAPGARENLALGMKVRYAELTGEISYFFETGESTTAIIDTEQDRTVHLADGTYDGEIVLESRTPISYLFN